MPLSYLMPVFYVYVLKSKRQKRYYIGCTKDVSQRLNQHNAGMTSSTRGFGPWRLVHTEGYETLVEARRREAQIKAWKSRPYMEMVLGLVE